MEATRRKIPTVDLEARLLSPSKRTLAHLAAHSNNSDALRDLLGRYGFSPVAEDERGWLPIHSAAASGAVEAFQFLRQKSDVAACAKGHISCLHLSAENGSAVILDRILSLPNRDGVLELRDKSLESPLHYASRFHHANCVKLLLDNGFNPNEPNAKNERRIHLLLSSKRDGLGNAVLNALSRRLRISPAVRADDVDIDALMRTLLTLLRDQSTDLNAADAAGATPLALAQHIPAAQRALLEDQRLDLMKPVRPDADTGFFVALRLGVWGAVRRYIEQHGLPEGTAMDADRNTVLHHLTARGAPADLLEQQIDGASEEQLNASNKKGETPLDRAILAKNWALTIRMIETGKARLHQREDGFRWEILQALKYGAPDGLLEHLARAAPALGSRTDGNGWTLLHHLCAHDHTEWVSRLAQLTISIPSGW
jgi:ankyrin repeat protein